MQLRAAPFLPHQGLTCRCTTHQRWDTRPQGPVGGRLVAPTLPAPTEAARRRGTRRIEVIAEPLSFAHWYWPLLAAQRAQETTRRGRDVQLRPVDFAHTRVVQVRQLDVALPRVDPRTKAPKSHSHSRSDLPALTKNPESSIASDRRWPKVDRVRPSTPAKIPARARVRRAHPTFGI